jgi:uncharacterized protein YdaU (DUF1376 family)
MSKPKLPHFPLFFGDLLAATPRPKWKGQHRSLYVLLLAHQWFYGPIPSDQESIADMCDYPIDEFKRLWQVVGTKFVETDGGLINLRCEEHREKAAKISKKRRVAGKKGGETTKSRTQQNRQQTGQQVLQQTYEQNDKQTEQQKVGQVATPVATPFAEPSILSHPNPSYSNPSARSAREESLARDSEAIMDAQAQEGWATCQRIYPPYNGRKHWIMAEAAARQLVISQRATWAVIEDRTKRYADFCRVTQRVVMRPENFFSTVDDPPCLQSWDLPEAQPSAKMPTMTRGDSVIDEFFKERAAGGKET